MKIYEIKRNKCQCRRCGDIIESKTQHDAVWCRCKSIMVDGGREYIRRLGNEDDILELSEINVSDVKDLVGKTQKQKTLIEFALFIEKEREDVGDFESIAEFYEVIEEYYDEYVKDIGNELIHKHISNLKKLSKYD